MLISGVFVFTFLIFMLKLLTNAHAFRGRPTLKDVLERFWNGLVRELQEKTKIHTFYILLFSKAGYKMAATG